MNQDEARKREQPLAAGASQVAETRRRLRTLDPIPRDKVSPDVAAIEPLRRAEAEVRRYDWRPALPRRHP